MGSARYWNWVGQRDISIARRRTLHTSVGRTLATVTDVLMSDGAVRL